MAIQLQLRRGPEEDHESFIGAPGEVTVDTTRNTLRVHDGSTLGGHELAKASLSNVLITKSLTPSISGEIDVGTVSNKWRDLYLTRSIRLGTIAMSSTLDGIAITGTFGQFEINQGLKDIDSPTFQDLTINGLIYGSVQRALKLEQGRTISITGDISYTSPSFDGSEDVTSVATLATVNSNVGTFGSVVGSITKVPIITVNNKGLVTGVTEDTVVTELPNVIEAGVVGGLNNIPVITYNTKGLITQVSQQPIDTELPDIIESGVIGSSSSIPVITYNEKGLITNVDEKRISSPVKQNTFKTISSIDALQLVDFDLVIGNSVVVYKVLVSHPCMVEVFDSPDRNDSNPYRFVATLDHLEDDGSTLLSDGTILRGRRYHIWSSFTNINNIYCRVTNLSENDISNFRLDVTYSVLEYNLEI